MHIAFIGNFEPEHSTENELRRALQGNGHDLRCYQEGSAEALESLIQGHLLHLREPIDFILWTRTGGLAAPLAETYWELIARARDRGIPVVGYHLDRWWGLKRQAELVRDPYFAIDLLVTADGGHADEWRGNGTHHVWMPPAISERHCHPGTQLPSEHDIVFVGSWQPGYHPEWQHRADLVRFLQKRYDRRVNFVPARGQPAIRGAALNDVYWSAKVAVGDSCLVPKVDGSPMTHYCSDRMPETLGRGGVLLHPEVEGINETNDDPFSSAASFGWRLGDWEDLASSIDELVNDVSPSERLEMREQSIEHIKAGHTYEVRMRQLCDVVDGMR